MATGDLTQGVRLPDADFGKPGPGWDAWSNGSCAAGAYMKVNHDHEGNHPPWWFIVDPRGEIGRIETHTVVEHEDGTVTVSPSIAPRPGTDGWHGYLERGIWREV